LELRTSNAHWKRFFTASLLIPILFVYIYWGGALLFVFLSWAGFSFGNREFFHLAYKSPPSFQMGLYWVLGTLVLWGSYFKGLEGLVSALIFGLFVCFFQLVVSFPNQGSFFESLGKQLVALFYLPFFLAFLIVLRLMNNGIYWIFFLMAVNSAGDAAAYYVGRTWGSHKLAPLVSPKKTIEGSLGGLAANLITAGIFQLTVFTDYYWAQIIGLGLVIGVISQLGDLFESVFKRTARVKDSGGLFPGHGGILDRIDSLLLPAPLVYFFIVFFQTG
jgi:phosphatidate cytidylyltransferase